MEFTVQSTSQLFWHVSQFAACLLASHTNEKKNKKRRKQFKSSNKSKLQSMKWSNGLVALQKIPVINFQGKEVQFCGIKVVDIGEKCKIF